MDARTDGWTDARGKTICLPTLSGGDIMRCTEEISDDVVAEYMYSFSKISG